MDKQLMTIHLAGALLALRQYPDISDANRNATKECIEAAALSLGLLQAVHDKLEE